MSLTLTGVFKYDSANHADGNRDFILEIQELRPLVASHIGGDVDANNAMKAALHPEGLKCDDLQWCDVIAREDYLVSEGVVESVDKRGDHLAPVKQPTW